MKVKTLLSKAKKCKTNEDAHELIKTLESIMRNTNALKHLPTHNHEAYLEDDELFVQFEFNRVLSEHYITMIRPEVRGDKFVIVVSTQRMLDGLGLESQSWESVNNLDDQIDSEESDTITRMAQKAKTLAIYHQTWLIEQLGVSDDVAFKVAVRSW